MRIVSKENGKGGETPSTQDRGVDSGQVPASVLPRQMSFGDQMHFLALPAGAARQKAELTQVRRQPLVDCTALQWQSNLPGVGTAGMFHANRRPPPGDPVSRLLKSNSAIGLEQMLSRTTRL